MIEEIQTALLHYAAPPVVGGVEAVIKAHVRAFLRAGYPITVLAGRGDREALPRDAGFVRLPRLDSQHRQIAEASRQLAKGQVPSNFDDLVGDLAEALAPELNHFDNLIVHNVFTKRFNLPLTAALYRLLDDGVVRNCIAWCHDIGWMSDHSRLNLYPGHPWGLLRTYREDVIYVVVSEQRKQALVELYDCSPQEIRVIHNGVDPALLLGLTDEGSALVDRLDLLEAGLILLMPVRVTEAKNVEYALQVVAALTARDYRPELVLTGPPDPHDEESVAYFRELQDLRRELGVEEEMRFVFESGPDPGQPFTVDMPVVADLFRVSDVVFMPSHREGFGMPVLEAGLIGVPVVCTDFPAAREIGGDDVTIIDTDQEPAQVAKQILSWAERSPVHRLRRRVRQNYTWRAIFHRDIEPLLRTAAAGSPTEARTAQG